MNAKEIKQLARDCGADICGIASLDRFEGAPKNMDPRYIMPEAKSLIVMGFRVMRGSLRGIEEGTFFSNYSAMGYGCLTYNYIPMTVINMCKVIEDEGYEAIPLGHQSDWRGIDNDGNERERYSRPVEEGKPQPDIMLHLRICGYLAGLGEIGYSKM
jgi:epoxyqueuosine reductase QueG